MDHILVQTEMYKKNHTRSMGCSMNGAVLKGLKGLVKKAWQLQQGSVDVKSQHSTMTTVGTRVHVLPHEWKNSSERPEGT